METIDKYAPKLEIISDAESLAEQSVDVFVSDAQKAIKDKGVFYVALSGGHTPKRFFELLGEKPESISLDWEKIHLFWVDERYVSKDSKWSNYKLASDTFLNKIEIPDSNIHSIPTEHSDSKMAAHYYEETIREVFGLSEKNVPVFDLIVLGMGVDGHIGSLFPDSYACLDTEDLACVVYVLDEKLSRITLTTPVLTKGKHLVILISGEEKAEILKEVLTCEPDDVRFPIHSIWPILNKVTWLVDSKAARFL